ncbi:MAG: AI-2E family transporter [Acidimicrobiia bacterium]
MSVPWAPIFGAIVAVVGTFLLLSIMWQIKRVLIWLVVAAFFAAVLHPAVSFVQRRLKIRRTPAAFLTVLAVVIVLFSMAVLFTQPLVTQARKLGDNYPQYVNDVAEGRGNLGRLAERLRLSNWVRDHEADLTENVPIGGGQVLDWARTVGSGVVAFLTIAVLSFLLVVQAPDLVNGLLARLREPTRTRVRALIQDSSRAVTGYVAGNLLISLVAGAVAVVALLVLGVPFAIPLAVWVAFADLIPLVGATLGAAPAVAVAFVHSVPAGIITLVVFIVYQQFENNFLQVAVMARTVALNPLLVLISVLVGVELLGFVGALLAIPVAGVVQVVAKDVLRQSPWYEPNHESPEPDTPGVSELSELPETP